VRVNPLIANSGEVDGAHAPFQHVFQLMLSYHFFNEALQPSLERSLPVLNDFNRRGLVGHAVLTGPLDLHFEYEPDDRTLAFADPNGYHAFQMLGDYDLVSPLTAIPLGSLRAKCPAWIENPMIRTAVMLTFIAARLKQEDIAEIWNWLKVNLTVSDLLLLLPDESLMKRKFADWTESDWRDHVWSAYWEISGDTMLFAPGRRSKAEMQTGGPDIKTFDDWRKDAKKE
jgi:hypothetical protein